MSVPISQLWTPEDRKRAIEKGEPTEWRDKALEAVKGRVGIEGSLTEDLAKFLIETQDRIERELKKHYRIKRGWRKLKRLITRRNK